MVLHGIAEGTRMGIEGGSIRVVSVGTGDVAYVEESFRGIPRGEKPVDGRVVTVTHAEFRERFGRAVSLNGART